MSKLPDVSGQQAISAFQKIGFYVARISGSHHIMKKQGHLFVLTIPVHGNRSLAKGTLRALIDAAGISVEVFTALLD